MTDVLRVADLSRGDLSHVLSLAEGLRAGDGGYGDLLDGRTVVCYFAEPSVRTRLSFATAVARLGGVPLFVGPAEMRPGRGEEAIDTARVVSQYASAFVVRMLSDADVRTLAAAATIPVINALSREHHPCQVIADLMTLRQRFGRLGGLRVAYVGDGNNIAHSLLEGCALAGVSIRVATPPAYEPDFHVVDRALELAECSGAAVEVTHDAGYAAYGADAVYTDGWLSIGDHRDQRQVRAEAMAPYRVDAGLMGRAADHAVFMHCLPAHRGEEVTADVIDGPRSLVLQQAANQLYVAQALLVAVIRGDLEGRELGRPDPALT
jgi:ornithine carbamoyltransferase